jgi:hypothetical protein
MTDQIYTLDWQQHEMEEGRSKLSHAKVETTYVPDVSVGIKWTKHDKYWIEEFTLEKESEATCLAILASMSLPFEVLRLIKRYWMESYYAPHIDHMAIKLALRFQGYLDANVVDTEVFVMGDVFFPRCRGYCIKCGEPVRKPPPLKINRIIKYRLHPRLLQLMRLCYGCCQLGFYYSEEQGFIFPTSLKSRKLRTYDFNCVYPKIISDMYFVPP